METGPAPQPLLRAAVGTAATLLLLASLALGVAVSVDEDSFLLIVSALAGLGLWQVSLIGRAPRLSTLLRDGAAITFLLLVRSDAYQIWQLPATWFDVLRLTPVGMTASLLFYFSGALATLVRTRRVLLPHETIALLAVPLLLNLAFALGAAELMAELGGAISGAFFVDPLRLALGRALGLFILNEAIAGALGFVIRGRPARDIRLHCVLAGAALFAAATPMIADLPQQVVAATGPAAIVLAVGAAASSQAGLWAVVFLATGLLHDALLGKPPCFAATWAHWLKGLVKGAFFGGIFMFLLLAGASIVHTEAIAGWMTAHPLISAAGCGALLYPLTVTIVASTDTTPAFFRRLAVTYRDARVYLRGLLVGSGVVMMLAAGLPGASSGTRFLLAFMIGAAAYSGVDFLFDAAARLSRRRKAMQSWRLYCIGTLLGGIVGGALGWYFDASQIDVVTTKFWAYVDLSYATTGRPTNAYVIYALFSKWGMVDLGPVGGGVRLFYDESLSGVINWSLAAPLFSVNYFLLAALIERSLRPLREMLSFKGLQGLVEQAVRVLRWGLWMAPVIYSFLRLSPSPSWYNQDGAVRTIAATIVDMTRPAADFNAWSLAVFTGLLAYDWLRILIWFDHMGLRVATLVNLSFLGADKADEVAARFAGHATRARIVPEAIRRFLTWAPLLIPFYIPRNAEWDQAWTGAEQIRANGPPIAPAVDGLIVVYLIAGAIAGLAGGAIAWRMWPRYRVRNGARRRHFVLSNGAIGVALRPDGRGYMHIHSIARTTRPFDVTRRPTDPFELRGTFFYLCDADTQAIWSLAREPVRRIGDDYHAGKPRPDRVEIAHTVEGVRSELRVTLDEWQAVEFRRIRLTETSGKARRLTLTSYQELALNELDVYERDPAFNAMHVETWFVRAWPAIFARNRLLRDRTHSEKLRRMSREVCFHSVRIDAGTAHVTGYEDSRTRFIGEGTLRAPRGVQPGRARDLADEGLLVTFDPAASLTIAVELAAHGTCDILFITGHARDEIAAARILAGLLHRGLPGSDRATRNADDEVRAPRRRRALEPAAPPSAETFPFSFTQAGRRLELTEATPRPWAHVLANPAGQGMVVSNEGAFYSFAGNARANGLTRWPFDPARAGLLGQNIYVVDLASGRMDTPGFLPFRRPDASHDVVYGLGYAIFRTRDAETELELTIGVAPDRPADMRLLTIRNRTSRERQFRIVPYFDMVLAEYPSDSVGKIIVAQDEATGVALFSNPANDFWSGWAFVVTSLAVDRLETVRAHFFGQAERDFTNPIMVETGSPDPNCHDDGRRIAAFVGCLTVPADGEAEVAIVLGQAPTRAAAIETALHFSDPATVGASLAGQEAGWVARCARLEVTTNDPGFDRLVNYWLPYQLSVSHLWGRVGPDQRSGAFGFRDQLQSALGLLFHDPAAARSTILDHAGQQFVDGRTLKWWHRVASGETGIGLRSLSSDLHLWLPYVAVRYIEALGDYAILDEVIAYLDGPSPERGVGGAVIVPRRSLEIDDLYGHCRRAIDLSLTQIGIHGLPLFGAGDWNDGIDVAGLEGRGESVWLACFLIDVLTTFVPLAELRNDAIAADYRQAADRLRQALDVAWRDGRYIIGFDDAGVAFEQASIMTAAWPVLSGAVGFERGCAALEAGLRRLERPDRILLIDPPFDETSVPYPGRIADYPPGVRENGAQYTHGATWVVDAFLRLAEMALEAGDRDVAQQMRQRAFAVWKKLSPLGKCEGDELAIYGLAPHQQPADICNGEGYAGRGGWSWYTGAAARMLTSAYSLLGLKFVQGRVVVPDDLFVPKGELQVWSLKVDGETFAAPRR